MEIEYSVFWETQNGSSQITHGKITDADLQEIIERKEREEWSGAESCKFESASIESINT